MSPKEIFQTNKFAFYGFYLRKSANGYSVDQDYYGYPMFITTVKTKKAAVNYIESQITKIQKSN